MALDPGGHLPTRGAHSEDRRLWPGHCEDKMEWGSALGAALRLCAVDGELGHAEPGACRAMGYRAGTWGTKWG